MSTVLEKNRTPKIPTESVLVEFMPGRTCSMPVALLQEPAKMVICRLVKQPNGLYGMVPIEWGPMVRMTRTLHQELGLPCSFITIYKLVKSGIVKGRLPAPKTLMIDLASLAEHFRRTTISPDRPRFWTRELTEAFRQAAGPMEEDE